jgi:hypothetical protein
VRIHGAPFIAAFITAAALASVPVPAQTAAAVGLPLTLAEAERRAVDRNPEIAQRRRPRVARLHQGPQRDLATAQTNELRAWLDSRTALVDCELAQEAP